MAILLLARRQLRSHGARAALTAAGIACGVALVVAIEVINAFEMIVCRAGWYLSSLTPMTTVTSSPLAGAEMMTFFAPPWMWPGPCPRR